MLDDRLMWLWAIEKCQEKINAANKILDEAGAFDVPSALQTFLEDFINRMELHIKDCQEKIKESENERDEQLKRGINQ